MAKICLTYARRDADAVGEIAGVLELAAHDVLRHVYDNQDAAWLGEPFKSALADADRWVIVLSANAVRPDILVERIQAAGDRRIPVVGVAIGQSASLNWKNQLPDLPIVDIGPHLENDFEKLLAAVRPTYKELRRDYEARMALLEEAFKGTLANVVSDDSTRARERVARIVEACQKLLRAERDFWHDAQMELMQRDSELEEKRRPIRERLYELLYDRLELLDFVNSGRPLATSERLVGYLKRHANRPFVIGPELSEALRAALLKCDQFASNQELRAIFGDSRLSSWRHGLPETGSISARVDAVVDYLRDKRSRDQESALVLLLRVLSDRYQDSLHDRLVELAGQLETARRRQLLAQLDEETRLLKRKKQVLSYETSAWLDLMEAVRQGQKNKVPIYTTVEEMMSIVIRNERQALERMLKSL